MPAVEVANVVKAYKEKVAVDGLSFSTEKGEVFGLIGPNGAGKTTTIRMMMDIIQPDSGHVAIFEVFDQVFLHHRVVSVRSF